MNPTEIVELAKALAWPTVAIILIVGLPFGILNSTASSLGKAFSHLFTGINDARKSFDEMTKKMSSFQEGANEIEESFAGKIDEVFRLLRKHQDTAFSELNEKFDEATKQIKIRINDFQVASDEETAEPLGELAPNAEVQSDQALVPDGQEAINKISARWEKFKGELKEVVPTGIVGDQRAVGAWARQHAGSPSSVFDLEMANKIAALHGLFKSYTRRGSYAEEWLTEGMLNAFLNAVDQTVMELRQQKAMKT